MCDTRITLCFDYETNESDPELFFNEGGELEELAEWTSSKLQQLWETAIESFPHDLDPTSIEQGEMPEDVEDDMLGYITEDLEYSVEYTFTTGTLGNSDLVAGGWINMRMDTDDNEPQIYGEFGVSLDGNFHDEDSNVLGEYGVLQTWFDTDSETWSDLEIGSM